ncbi:MAG: PAS domain-containing protein [Lysobacteraceae bacterium]|nr:MAG: PAS domain-containing protein [Xanthomonadaceae bacterium]
MASDTRLFLLVLGGAAIPAALFIVGVSGKSLASDLVLATLAISAAWSVILAFALRRVVLRHIRALSSLIETARMQEYGIKSRGMAEPGELSQLYQQVNALTDSLAAERQSEQELLGVLEKVVSQINVAIVVCDSRDRVRLVNQRACRLLGASAESLIGLEFAQTALATVPLLAEPRLLNHSFPGGEGPWQVSQQQYRHLGKPSRIVFVTDLKQVLSDEEISAWQRLIRVISHEVNNSLTPIISLCQTLSAIQSRSGSADSAADVRDGLGVISERARGLKEFITAYARIARLPEPNKILFPVDRLVSRIRGMFPDDALHIAGPVPELMLFGDPVHIEQALINLVRNGLEAGDQDNPAPSVHFSCRVRDGSCVFEILDDGVGISNPGNLFVPFYTTKSEGAGIGLVLCRQIATQHHGQVELDNRPDARGAIAKLILPMPARRHDGS